MLEKMITNSSLRSHEACSYEKKPDPIFLFFLFFFSIKKEFQASEKLLWYLLSHIPSFRSSHREVFRKKSVLRNLAKFTGKGLRPATLLKRRLWYRFLPVNFAKYLRTLFLRSTSGRLLLKDLRQFFAINVN